MSHSNSHSSINYLPCGIKANGPLPVESYFKPVKSADGTLTSSFRGRKLRGMEVKLPQNTLGFVVHVSGTASLEIAGSFKSVQVWEHDNLPSKSTFIEPLEWFDIAKQVY
jgi:ribonuclease H2 subunit C